MADVSVAASVISATGTLLGALVGIASTYGVTVRREETQARRQRRDQRRQARQQAYDDLLGAAIQLKVEIEITEQRHWNDMDVKLAAIQQHAVSAGRHALRVALLSPETADAARALASASSRLAALTAKHTSMDDQGSGEISFPADFTEFDQCIERFSRAAAQDREE